MTMRHILLESRAVELSVGPRAGNGSSLPLFILLFSNISAVFLVFITLVLLQGCGSGNGDDDGAGTSNADRNRIKETLQVGKTYHTILKVGLDARVEDKDWGITQVTSLVYAAEMAVDRKIECNDGRRIVELRHFGESRSVKLLTEVEYVSIDLGLAGILALGALDYIQPGAGTTIVAAKPIAEAILARGANEVAKNEASKAFAHVNSLAGKTVRITYVDGEGVESVEAVRCSLSETERNFVKASTVLSDYHIMPELNIKVGGAWSVAGGQFGGFLDPSLRGVPTGQIVVVRDSNHAAQGKEYATLRIQSGYLTINESDDATRRIGTFTPRGTLKYSISDRIVETASLQGKMIFEQVSRDHLLFESSFKVTPELTVSYSCEIR